MLGLFLTRNARMYSDREALVYEDTRETYRELNNRVNSLANGLTNMGFQKGDFISVLSLNCSEYAEIMFAFAKIGVILAPLNTRMPAEEIKTLVNQSQSKGLILGPQYIGHIDSIKPELKSVKEYIVIGDEGTNYMSKYEDIISKYAAYEPKVEVNLDDAFNVNYSSGTTGLPKASILSHFSQLICGFQKSLDQGMTEQDVHLCAFPQDGRIGIGATLLPIAFGSKVIIINYNPQSFMKAIEKEKVTTVDVAPVMLELLRALPDLDKYDTSSLRAIYSIGSKLSKETLEFAWKRFGYIVGEYYGTTETCPIVNMRPNMKRQKPESCGFPASMVQVRIVDENSDDVLDGEQGEIIMRGPALNANYIWDPENTKRFMKQGWFHTEDLGRFDKDGYLYVTGRVKDMIVSGAHNVFAPKVEKVIESYPKVWGNAVIGVPHKLWGEAVVAIVVPKPGEEVTEEEIIEYTKNKLPNWECPKYVRFEKDGLPRNPNLKVLKRVLREKYANIAEK